MGEALGRCALAAGEVDCLQGARTPCNQQTVWHNLHASGFLQRQEVGIEWIALCVFSRFQRLAGQAWSQGADWRTYQASHHLANKAVEPSKPGTLQTAFQWMALNTRLRLRIPTVGADARLQVQGLDALELLLVEDEETLITDTWQEITGGPSFEPVGAPHSTSSNGGGSNGGSGGGGNGSGGNGAGNGGNAGGAGGNGGAAASGGGQAGAQLQQPQGPATPPQPQPPSSPQPQPHPQPLPSSLSPLSQLQAPQQQQQPAADQAPGQTQSNAGCSPCSLEFGGPDAASPPCGPSPGSPGPKLLFVVCQTDAAACLARVPDILGDMDTLDLGGLGLGNAGAQDLAQVRG